MIAVEDHKIAVQDRTTAKPMSTDELADIGLPPLLAVKIDRRQDDSPGRDVTWCPDIRSRNRRAINLQERYENRFPIGRGRPRRMAVELMNGFQRRPQDLGLPQLLAGSAVQADQHPSLIRFQASRQEQPLAPDDR